MFNINTPKNIYMDNELKAGFIQSEKTFNNKININNTFYIATVSLINNSPIK